MATKELGLHFDIHGGGLDLKFPHHENEIAQTCGATHARFAEIWMHNGFLSIDNEKMSKSLGNFFTAREVMTKIKHPEVLRFFLLSSQYRGPMNYSPEQLTQAEATLRGQPASDATFRQAADIVLREAKGFGHNTFKIELARRVIVRALRQAARGTPQSQSNKKIG